MSTDDSIAAGKLLKDIFDVDAIRALAQSVKLEVESVASSIHRSRKSLGLGTATHLEHGISHKIQRSQKEPKKKPPTTDI